MRHAVVPVKKRCHKGSAPACTLTLPPQQETPSGKVNERGRVRAAHRLGDLARAQAAVVERTCPPRCAIGVRARIALQAELGKTVEFGLELLILLIRRAVRGHRQKSLELLRCVGADEVALDQRRVLVEGLERLDPEGLARS